jgi:radical SAM superfamily enzyme YgiQ (UPF0313 family)
MRNEVYKKNITKRQIKETVEALIKAGIVVRAFVMIGGPGETSSSFDETLSFSKSIGLTLSDLIIIRYVPLPKTPLVARIEQDKIQPLRSIFSYHNLRAMKSLIPKSYFLKLRILKVFSFIREGVALRGARFFGDVLAVLYKNGKGRFIPVFYLCNEQRLVNWTITRYKKEKKAAKIP